MDDVEGAVAIAAPPALRARVRAALQAAGIAVGAEADDLSGLADDDALAIVVGRAARRSDAAGRAGHADEADADVVLEPMTARERDVLEALSDGLANRQIAARLGISEHTVKFHLESIYGKLGASSRADAIRRGVRRGLITL